MSEVIESVKRRVDTGKTTITFEFFESYPSEFEAEIEKINSDGTIVVRPISVAPCI